MGVTERYIYNIRHKIQNKDKQNKNAENYKNEQQGAPPKKNPKVTSGAREG